MANVFFSYSRADRAIVQPLIKAIEKQGYSVWWDSHLRSGNLFRRSIAVQLAAAQCVVVAWSENSIQSDWVIDEAEYANKQDKLLPILISDCQPPMGLRQIQAENLVSCLGTVSGGSWDRFLGDLADCVAKAKLKGVTGEVDEAAQAEARIIQKAAGGRKRYYLAVLMCLIIIVGATTLFGYIYPYQVAALVSPEVQDDLDALRYGSNFPDNFRRVEKWIARGDKYRILRSIGPERFAEIVSFGHRANSESSVLTVLQYLVDSAPSELSQLGAGLDAANYLKNRTSGQMLASASQVESRLIELIGRNRMAAPVCNIACTQEWLYIPAVTSATSQPPAAICVSRTDTTVADYRVFDSSFAPTSAETEPARSISWFAANSYAHWRQARLPTLAELQGVFALSALNIQSDSIYANAWLLANSGDQAQPVATRAADKLSLKDLIGNVYEWTASWTPSSGSDPASYTRTKVIFGASYQTDKAALDLSMLNYESPFAERAYVGFRLARAPTKDGNCNFTQNP